MTRFRRTTAFGVVATAWLTVAAGSLAACTRAEPTGPVTEPASYTVVLGSTDLDTFKALAGKGLTLLSPDRARLVGPTYGVDFDAVGTATVLDGTAYRQVAGVDPDYARTHYPRDVVAGPGREFVLAHVPANGHLPEPGLGYGSGPLYWPWLLTVAGQPRVLASDDTTPCLCTGSVIVVDVAVGEDVELGATANGETQWISLRTGTAR